MICKPTPMWFEIIMLSESSLAQKNEYCMISLMCVSDRINLLEINTESKMILVEIGYEEGLINRN